MKAGISQKIRNALILFSCLYLIGHIPAILLKDSIITLLIDNELLFSTEFKFVSSYYLAFIVFLSLLITTLYFEFSLRARVDFYKNRIKSLEKELDIKDYQIEVMKYKNYDY